MRATLSLAELSSKLATTDGGFSLWLGAGASIAVTNGATPGWRQLVSDLRGFNHLDDEADEKRESVDRSYPEQLERLSSRIGHHAFRKELRKRLLDPMVLDAISQETVLHQATIGARANAVVSFNIEVVSAMSFVSAFGECSFRPRTFRERHPDFFGLEFAHQTTPGMVSPTIYFPHGLLNDGNLVMTKSEYDLHEGSLAMATAVQLCLGSDLVILGMSLADTYLRREILRHRRWIRRIYWVGEKPAYDEWRRVARVTFVEAPHKEVWKSLAERFQERDAKGSLSRAIDGVATTLESDLSRLLQRFAEVPQRLEGHAQMLLELSRTGSVGDAKFSEFAQLCIDMGCDVPKAIADHPRLKL